MPGTGKASANRCILSGICLLLTGCAAAPKESPVPAPTSVQPPASATAPVASMAEAAPSKSAPQPVPQSTQSAPTPAGTLAAPAEPAPAASAPESPTKSTAATTPTTKPTAKPISSKPVSTTPAKPATAAPEQSTSAAAKPAAAPALDLAALEQRLRDTKAIGLFTKLSIKNQVDDLLDDFRAHFKGQTPPLTTLRQRYDLLLMKVLTLLQDGDPPLASAINSSREAIWNLLNDPTRIAST